MKLNVTEDTTETAVCSGCLGSVDHDYSAKWILLECHELTDDEAVSDGLRELRCAVCGEADERAGKEVEA